MINEDSTYRSDGHSMVETLFDNFERAIKREGSRNYLIKLGILAATYIAFAKLGLTFAFSFEQVTTIWPPTGIAIAAFLFLGYHYWPGVFVGAFIINSLSDVSPTVAIAIAIGNTLEALVAVYLVRRLLRGDILNNISNVIGYVLLGAFISPIIGASIGTLSLLAGDYLSLSELMHAWVTWWIGDMMGALIIVPLIAAWRIPDFREMLFSRLYEAVAMLLLVVMTSLIIFNQPAADGELVLPLVYLVFPLIILTAARFMQIGAVTTAAILTTAAVWSTTSGLGPYAQAAAPEKGLLILHFFILVSALTALVLSVAVYGRVESEKALAQKARELERAQRQVLKNAEQRKDLQLQMKEAQDRINDILVGIIDSESSSDRRRRG